MNHGPPDKDKPGVFLRRGRAAEGVAEGVAEPKGERKLKWDLSSSS